ncbi:hypothetical protein UM93_05815 [Psychromicrobium lacuslunae]|uniref:Adenylate synthase n=1 Tax=Psychromicrobium lacuslunae TaxID=1618207 RepID=A0A0D4C3C7_9MICC|nr:hypothetical protein UM93_05815 [Psychromicrobium lacuslunae]
MATRREQFAALAAFCRTRWGYRFGNRTALLRWQHKRLSRMLRTRTLDWASLPVIDKATLLADFSSYNSQGIGLEKALSAAKQSERSRDFRPELAGLTVGLSSGTSGKQGVFLLSSRERLLWAGTILARLLSTESLRQLVQPWRPALRIGFLLRADSNLYNTVRSSRVSFDFYDLLEPLEDHLQKLEQRPPDLLVGPASVLAELARQQLNEELHITPRQLISVAEELDDATAELLERAFRVRPAQVYQATEGLLGFSCRRGKLHLNEQHVFFEKDWLDAEHTRFSPIITDFTRSTQFILRYRLDDVLRLADHPCDCGNQALTLAAVDGRADAVLSFDGVKLFPDLIRRSMALASSEFDDWSLRQRESGLLIALKNPSAAAIASVRRELGRLFDSHHLALPTLTFVDWQAPLPGAKLRRIFSQLAAS